MENIPTPNSDFENYLRKHLQEVDATPDDSAWAEIAGKQAQPNRWMKFRRFRIYVAGAVLFIASTIGIWWYQHSLAALNSKKAAAQLQQEAVPDTLPMATLDTSWKALPAASEVSHLSKQVFAPNFSSRINAVPATTVRFQAENGLRYQNPVTGTCVSIPANSLVDQNGERVQGEAELFFREYRTIADFLASGIPMHYSDGRGQFFFNSGGMFEVRVSQMGTALEMGTGQGYDVAFSPTETLEKASLYFLDDQTGAWQFLPDGAFGQANLNEPPVVTEETAVSNNLKGASQRCDAEVGQLADEPEPADFVKLGVKTGFELSTGKLKLPMWFKKNPYLTDDQLLFRLERGLVQIKKHRDQTQLFFPEDLNHYFTELAAFKNCYFTYNVDSLGGARKAKLVTNSDYWQRITVKPLEGANCVITLFDGKDGQMQFHATLTGSTENKIFQPEKVMAEYKRLREERQQDFAEKNRALRYFLYAASAFKTKEEWCFSVLEWLEYFEKNQQLMAMRYAALVKAGLTTDDALATEAWKKWQQVLRDQRFDRLESNSAMVQSKNNLAYTLRLSNFGTYNCDQIFRLSGRQGFEYVAAGYKTATGTRIIPAFVSVMERRTRLFFTLPSSTYLVYCPDRKLDIIITDRNGRQYHLPAEKYASQKFDKTGVTVLTLNDVTDQTQSPRAWANLLEI